MNEADGHDVAWEARCLVRAARSGTLATASDGQPFASLVTPAVAGDGSLLLLLSDLSEHTKQLRADARCAVMLTGAATGPNAQTTPRVTLTGQAAIEPDPAFRARWVSTHPYAGFYAGFGDFNLWRIRPEGGLFVAGFARAHRLTALELAPPAAACDAIGAAEASVMAHCNADHADTLAVIAQAAGHPGDAWRMIACDADGFDLADEEHCIRVAWPAPVEDPGGVRKGLIALAAAARAQAATSPGPPLPAAL